LVVLKAAQKAFETVAWMVYETGFFQVGKLDIRMALRTAEYSVVWKEND
jgi:hypothetical protein